MASPPQALFVCYSAVLGGAERILLDRADALSGPAALACPEGPLATRAQAQGMAWIPLPATRPELRGSARDRVAAPLRLAAHGREVRGAVRDLRPRCVVGWSMRGLLAATGALAGLPLRPPLVFQHNDLLPSPAIGRAVRAAASRADRVVALSHAIAEDLDPTGRLAVDVIHPGVDLGRFAPSPLPGGVPEALVLGAVVGWKRPDLALEAGALAAREIPDLRLRVCGPPMGAAGDALLARLGRRAQEPDLRGRVRLEAGTEDVPGALAESTCLLHCAEREPFGMVLAEALACGRPVAAPGEAGPREIVDASCGALYEPGDAEAAARALVDVVRRASELAGPARERAERLFDRRTADERFRRLVDEVAGVPA